MQHGDASSPLADWMLGLLFLALIAAPVFGAYLLDKRRQSQIPSSRQDSAYIHEHRFRWGYFFGIGCFVFGAGYTAIFFLAAIPEDSATPDALAVTMLTAYFLFIAFLGILTCRLNRWAFALLSLLTFNPVLWLINAIYGAKRWTWRTTKPRLNDAPTPTPTNT